MLVLEITEEEEEEEVEEQKKEKAEEAPVNPLDLEYGMLLVYQVKISTFSSRPIWYIAPHSL